MKAFLSLALSLFSLLSFAPWTVVKTPEKPEVPAEKDRLTQQITTMSFNVYYKQTGEQGIPKRKEGVVKTILSEKPDSFGLQEAHRQWRDILLDALGETYAMACARGRSFDKDDEGVPIFYRKDKFELVKEEVFWLSPTPGRPSYGWGASLPRVAGYALLRDKKTGFAYVHVNAHFDHVSSAARDNSALIIVTAVKDMRLPVVFTGDLNAQPGAKPMRNLEAGGLIDLRKAAAKTDTGPTFHSYESKLTNDKILDYIYANHYLRKAKEFKVIRDEYNGLYPSDHFAICAKLVMAN